MDQSSGSSGHQEAVSWPEFRTRMPDMAAAGQALLYQFGVGLGYLATVRPDGGPRLHPMCPVINDEGLFALIVPSPKRNDLIRDGRFALHAFPTDSNEDAFYVTGHAHLIEEAATRERIVSQFVAERGNMDPARVADELPFEFFLDACLLTRTTGHGDWNPQHTVWRAT
jgi:hypothetical protein